MLGFKELVCAGALLAAPAWADTVPEPQVRAAAEKSIALLQKVGAAWKPECLSCHSQALPAIAYSEARAHGLKVDEKVAQATSERAFAYLSSIDEAVQDSFLIDPPTGEGYALSAAYKAGVEPSLATAAYARRLANLQRAGGHWVTFDARPPHGDSVFTASAVAVRTVAVYMPPELADARRACLERARAWFLSHEPANTEDATYKLLGLLWTEAPMEDRSTAAAALLKGQRDDGGWAQTAAMQSDAYATAQVLYALRTAGNVAADDVTWQRGLKYLLRTQRPDGAWLVKTRLHTPAPFSPPYFESGFPGGHSQYISSAATSYAVMALALALPETGGKTAPVASTRPKGAQKWMQTALFGTAAELDTALKAGLDPNSATAEGTTALMMAAGDSDKVRLLVERGAKVDARSKSGFDALMVASLYPGNIEVLHSLVAHGADAKPRAGVRFNMTALIRALYTGDTGMIEELLAHGADPKRPVMLVGFVRQTPLALAAELDDVDSVKLLLRHGVDVNEKDTDQMTALQWTALMHRPAMVKALLDLGANPNHVDKFGSTALRHTSEVQYQPETTAALLRPVTKVSK
jgi:hypothetical protein